MKNVSSADWKVRNQLYSNTGDLTIVSNRKLSSLRFLQAAHGHELSSKTMNLLIER